ncbi:MAG TPA: Rieske 2Fe-2S domain-containing protein [Candidatus Polarisedimenticolaceae bacterium]|nr:Rieske 2Fe-2S domain-containing protein [Candidatus Polarisedimenticolaceae bacterium]
MSAGYRAIGWNPQKRRYDAAALAGIGLCLGAFVGVGWFIHPHVTAETLLIRGLGTTALVLLHVILAIGPAARLWPGFLPLLYNRRHLGVTMFLTALAHATFSLIQFHGQGDLSPLVSLLAGSTGWTSVARFPFEILGVAAMGILFLMAATSHDFWLTNLTAPVWKTLHMGVYAAYGLIVLHVALGALQAERRPVLAVALVLGAASLAALHLVAGARERPLDVEAEAGSAGFVDAGAAGTIPENRARTICVSGERIAIFRHEGKLSAVSAVCQHQNGPLGEGRILDGCITCPWHGYQYLPESGRSPAPFTEKVPTFRVRVRDGRVEVDPRPLPAGTAVEPARIAAGAAQADPDFYVGYLPLPPPVARRLRRTVALLLVSSAACGVAFIVGQGPFAPARFEFSTPRRLSGRIVEAPYPALLPQAQAGVLLPLVAPGKHGAEPLVRGLEGREVVLEGKAIERDGEALLEIVAGSVAPAAAAPAAAELHSEDLGPFTLAGEIVDSKCFLGVMNPGERKPHRACARRCISGGVPPALHVRDRAGRSALLWLVSARGEPVRRDVLEFVAEPVEITGRVERRGGRLFLYADPARYRRL